MTHRGPFQLNQLSDSVVLKAGSVFTEIILSNNKIVKKKKSDKEARNVRLDLHHFFF